MKINVNKNYQSLHGCLFERSSPASHLSLNNLLLHTEFNIHYRFMKKIAGLLAAIFVSLTAIAANPDFAYPKTTLEKALKHYDVALKTPDNSGIELIKSLLEIAGATAAIDPDSIVNVISKTDRAADALSDGAYKALVMAVKAELLNSIYKKSRWTFDNRETPDDPLPADITEWNGRQMRNVISSTLTQAFDMASASPSAGLSEFSQIIKADRLALKFFPDVPSFIASKAVTIIRYLSDNSDLKPIVAKMAETSQPRSDAFFYWKNCQNSIFSKNYNEETKALFDKYPDCEAAGYILIRALQQYSKGNAPAWAIPTLENFINSFPGFWAINRLKNMLAEFRRPSVTVQCRDIAAPGVEFDINLNYSYAHTAGYKIYKITSKEYNDRNFKRTADKAVRSFSIISDPAVATADTTVSITFDRQGYYAIMPIVNGESSRYTMKYLRCFPYLPTLITQTGSNVVCVADYVTGAPVKGASVIEKISTHTGGSQQIQTFDIGRTGADGCLSFVPGKPEGQNWYRTSYDITYNNATFNFFNSGQRYISQNETPVGNITLFIDRQIYHPGDTIRWAAIATTGTSSDEGLVSNNTKLHVELRNPNNLLSDSTTVTTDAYGRAYGSFVAPVEGLTGMCSIRATCEGNNKSGSGYRYFEVSDFKLPTFRIENVKTERDVPSAGAVSLSAKALTYSDMPVAGAKVDVEIWAATRFRWISPSRKLGDLTAVTDSKGVFSIIVPDSLTADIESKCFTAKIVVTSSDGEARHTSTSFTIGKPYILYFAPNVAEFNTDKPIDSPFAAYDASGKEVSIAVRWWLTPSGKDSGESNTVASGECLTGKQGSIDLKNLPAGEWDLTIAPVDSTLADTANADNSIITYSISRNLVPPFMSVFTPDGNVTATADGRFKLTFGVSADSTYVYQSFAAGDKAVSMKVGRFNTGFHTIDLALPKSSDDGAVVLFTVRNGIQTQQKVVVHIEDLSKLTLEGSAMRDRLTSGSSERWIISLKDASDHPVSGAMISTMFNSALNALSPYDMPSNLGLRRRFTVLWATPAYNSFGSATMLKDLKSLTEAYLRLPEFNPAITLQDLYGYKSMARSLSITTGGQINGILVAEDEEYQTLDNAAIIGYAPERKSMLTGAVAGVGATESAPEPEEEVYATLEGLADEGSAEPRPDDNFQYREGEVLQAFWMPDLVFDRNGETLMTFTVPDANTTWTMNAFAWAKDMRTATMMREFVTSKPVMVQPNLPRFLRVGDEARLLATVYNNSDSTAEVTTVVEIFDIASDEVISTFKSVDNIAASASAIVAATVSAPGNAASIGYRVRSTIGRFTDGEQNFIPIKASESDVIESENFYLNPGEASVSIDIPKGKGMESTLDYTANPAWNIIKELPGISTGKPTTSTGAARRLFAAATAAGLLRSYPDLAKAIDEWSADPDAGALTSRLAKNDALKAAILNCTPWVQAAAGDTERMARLSMLFDRKATAAAIRSSIETLKKLQCADGGWSWGEWDRNSSRWITNVILQDLGRLNSIGYLPDDKDLKNMISRAISYYTSTVPLKAKTDCALAFITTLFPDEKIDLRATGVVNATVQDLIGSWKKHSLWDKSIEAMILAAKGHPAVAGQIMESVSEFAVRSKDKGTSFPSVTNVNDYADLLYAFGKLDPKSELIDGMRQWLVIRQQSTTDLGSVDPTRVIAAFATNGSKWLDASDSKTDITINRQPLSINGVERLTGHTVTSLPADAAGKRLEISRGNSSVPAYGSVISRFIRRSDEIKARPCDDLSIEKRITALRDGRWQYVDEVRLGEQVRVLLTIKAKRDLEYVTVIDERPASFEPVNQLPGWVWSDGTGFYRENRDSETRLFIDYMRKGTYQLTVEMTASVAGEFTTGIATIQSQLTPSITAHSAGFRLSCK